MIQEIFSDFGKGARDALHAYGELILLPFTLARDFADRVSKALDRF